MIYCVSFRCLKDTDYQVSCLYSSKQASLFKDVVIMVLSRGMPRAQSADKTSNPMTDELWPTSLTTRTCWLRVGLGGIGGGCHRGKGGGINVCVCGVI